MTRSQNDWNRPSIWLTLAVTLSIVGGLVWYLRPSTVELSPDTYDIAVALYRVCNQEDSNGLEQIQGKLSELESTTTAEDPSILHLRSIVETANAGDWNTAMRDARQALQQQVHAAG